MIQLKKQIEVRIAEALESLGIVFDTSDIILEKPGVRDHGDYACNIAMRLAKAAGKNPRELAQAIVTAIPASSEIKKIELAGPGFINFYVSDQYLNTEVVAVLTTKDRYGAPAEAAKTRVMIEHTAVNPNKEPHIGHLRNTCIGDSLAHLYRLFGYDTKVLYYHNDIGQQIASILLAVRHQFVKREDYDSLIKWASAAYADVERRLVDNPELLAEKNAIQVAIAEQNTPESRKVEEVTTAILREILMIFRDLNVSYDLIVKESDIVRKKLWEQTFEKLKTHASFKYIDDGEKKGCWVIQVPNAEDKIMVRSNGVPTYAATDVAGHLWKFGILPDFHYEKVEWGTQSAPLFLSVSEGGEAHTEFTPAGEIVNIIDQTQTYPQQSVIEALRVLGFTDQADHYHHVNYGFVYLSPKTARDLNIAVEDGATQVKISGRKGTTITIPDFLSKMEAGIREKYDTAEESIIAVRNGAIKFEFLKYNTYQDMVFDLEAALDLKGFSGPYIQYAYTRAVNVLGKSEKQAGEINPDVALEDVEREMVRVLSRYPEVLEMALSERAPHQIALYLFELAQEYNSFYAAARVVGDPREAIRLSITAAVAQVLKNGLGLLGIEAPEKM